MLDSAAAIVSSADFLAISVRFCGTPASNGFNEALIALNADAAFDGEAAIARYDALIAAQAQCLFALSCHVEAKDTLNQLMRDAGALENEVLAARSAALNAIREADASKATAAEIAIPTDDIVTAH